MISNERVEKAMHYLVDTDDSSASAFALVKKLHSTEKTILGREYLKATGTVAEREAKAATSSEYAKHLEKVENAWADHKYLENKRASERIVIDMYRTLSANQRNG